MYNNQYMLDSLNRQKEKIEDMIRSYQQPTPVNNFINTNQTPNKDLVEWRVLNENEEVDNLYVANKTLFVSENMMVLKGVDGSLEKWKITKTYPIDKKDEKINALEEKIKELEARLNEPTKPDESTRERNESNGPTNVDAKSKPKTNAKPISREE